MSPNEQILWDKIKLFDIDDADVSFPFSQRLARENGWTKEYALRVIEEYKKFLFLCCITEKGVTPSDPVDQAWHLHLTYTKSYWAHLCRDTLGKEIHHNPTKGGDKEASKFDEHYTDTQQTYLDKFGEFPLRDIWPDNNTRFTDIDFQRINRRQNWIIRKPSHQLKQTLILCGIALSALFFIQAADDTSNYILAGVILVMIIALSRNQKKGGNGSGCSGAGCGSGSDHGGHHGDSGCGSGCSGCGGGCSGGGD